MCNGKCIIAGAIRRIDGSMKHKCNVMQCNEMNNKGVPKV
jgi:uncharacterized protein YqhQ